MILDRAARLVGLDAAVRSDGTRTVLVGSGLAWVVLTVWAVREGGAAHHVSAAGSPWRVTWLLAWLLMVIAMMWPLVIPALAVVGERAFRAWRVRLLATCLGTVTVLWVAAGCAVAALAHVLAVPPGNPVWPLGWVVVALIAGRSAWRARVLWRCMKMPGVAPGGVRGLATTVVAGAVVWRRCALLCGPAMAAMVVSHDPILMVGASVAAWWETGHPRAWRDPVPTLLLTAVAGWLVLLLVAGA